MVERELTSQIKIVIFGEELLIPTLTGHKHITIRKYRLEAHDLEKDELFIGRFKEGLDILLRATAHTEVKTFGDLTDEEARQDGFENAQDAFVGMGKYYPNLRKTEEMAVIRYEIAKIQDIPVVKVNDFFQQ